MGELKQRKAMRRYKHDRKRVQRLMRKMGLEAISPPPRTSRPASQHRIFPYLLRGLLIDRQYLVWSTGSTYVSMPQGFMYLVAM